MITAPIDLTRRVRNTVWAAGEIPSLMGFCRPESKAQPPGLTSPARIYASAVKPAQWSSEGRTGPPSEMLGATTAVRDGNLAGTGKPAFTRRITSVPASLNSSRRCGACRL
jgi:hypothetical protein